MTGEERIPSRLVCQAGGLRRSHRRRHRHARQRIAHIRTWTFVSNRADWLGRPGHWQERTKAIEDSLSDALHERLTQRFVDRRTSALMRGMKEKDELYAEIAEDGAVKVERHYVGRLKGFRFFADTEAEGIHGKATRNAAAHVLPKSCRMRVRRVVAAKSDAFKLTHRGQVLWRDEEIAAWRPATIRSSPWSSSCLTST
jgi:ATP-dependent RNA helicase SUPV3L1/SUV3